jgi:hypothetical protein
MGTVLIPEMTRARGGDKARLRTRVSAGRLAVGLVAGDAD